MQQWPAVTSTAAADMYPPTAGHCVQVRCLSGVVLGCDALQHVHDDWTAVQLQCHVTDGMGSVHRCAAVTVWLPAGVATDNCSWCCVGLLGQAQQTPAGHRALKTAHQQLTDVFCPQLLIQNTGWGAAGMQQ